MVHALLEERERVVVLDDLSTGFRGAVPERAKFVCGDVGDAPTVLRLLCDEAIDAVVHFAGSVVVPESVERPIDYYLNNTAASSRLLKCCQEAGVRRFVFSSTAAVYGEPDEVPTPEDAPLRPVSPYGASKMMVERILDDAAKAGVVDAVVLRYFNVAGADPRGRVGQSTEGATHLIKVACQTALGVRGELQIFGDDYPTEDGTGVRDYIHVWDLVRAHQAALHHLRAGRGGTVLNCGYGRGASVRQVIAAVEAVSGRRLRVVTRPRRPGDPAAVVARADRIRMELGWNPELDDLHRIVEHAFAWEKKLQQER